MIDITTIGLQVLKRKAGQAKKRLKERKKLNARATVIIDKWIQKNFQTEGKEVGGWEDLAEATKERRRKGKKKAKGHKILQDTGQLKTRWKHFFNHKIARVTSNVRYAVYHDSEKKPRKYLPRRQILPDSKHIEKQLEKIYDDFASREIKKVGL